MPVARACRALAALAATAVLAAGAAPARAFVPDAHAREPVATAAQAIGMPLAEGAPAAALERSGAWRAFRERHGDWHARWNAATGTPHRASGPAIPLAGFAGDAASVDRALRAFVAGHLGVFGAAPDLVPRSIRRHGAVWYASYRQRLGGLDVLFADWEFRVSAGGRLMLFGADALAPAALPPARPRIAPAAARVAATAGLAFDPARDVATAAPAALLPLAGGGARVVLPVTVRTSDPPGAWLALVDAATGERLARIERARAITGRITGLVHPRLPTEPRVARPFANEWVWAGDDSVLTDSTGAYTIATAATGPVHTELRGAFVDVTRLDVITGGDAAFDTTVAPGAVVDVPWGDVFSHDAERDAFRNANIAHDAITSVDTAFTGLDYPLPVLVNYPYQTCNAVWTGHNLYLFNAGNGCVNTATVPSVLFHEYGHAVNDKVYQQDGFEDGMLNGALQEGTADVFAAFIEDDPRIGFGFDGPGTWVRDISVHSDWPVDQVPDPHATGQVAAGALWDLRLAIGLDAARRLWAQARHGHPDDPHDGVAFEEVLLDLFVADDDDGDLANGTPHAAAIAGTFGAHGIGPNLWIAFADTESPDPPAGDVTIGATIRWTGPAWSALDPASATLHVARDAGPFTTLPMAPGTTPDRFEATLEVLAGTVLRYYVTAREAYGTEARWPAGAPERRVATVLVGPASPVLAWDMETDPGWVVGAPGDVDTAGLWVRVDPVGTAIDDTVNVVPIQPADDHTPDGTRCWVTGNADTMFVPGTNDVDGITTLMTATFDALPSGTVRPVIEYWRWYTNQVGPGGADLFAADISNDDGASWVPLERQWTTANSWERVLVRIEDFVEPTHTMRVRFVVNDDDPSSVVEAAIDDFRLLAFPAGTVLEAPVPRAAELAAPWPNPARGTSTLRLRLPAATHVRLAIYDVSGRRVRALTDAELPAGERALTWDGTDDTGRATPAGLYLARLETTGVTTTRRIVRMR